MLAMDDKHIKKDLWQILILVVVVAISLTTIRYFDHKSGFTKKLGQSIVEGL